MRRRTVILLIVLVLIGIGITIFRVFFIRAVYVPTGSMANTIIPGDTLLITKSFGKIERGALILFQYSPEYIRQEDRDHDPFGYRIARVVGLREKLYKCVSERFIPTDTPWESKKC